MDTKIKTIRLKNSLIEAVSEIAEKENRNFNNMVETILLRFLKKDFYCHDYQLDIASEEENPKKCFEECKNCKAK